MAILAWSEQFSQFVEKYGLLTIEALVAVLTLFVAVATWRAARSARKSAEAAERANQAQLFSQLFDHYTDPAMAGYIRSVIQWHRAHGPQAAQTWLAALADPANPLHQQATDVEKARRIVHAFFAKAIELVRSEFLAEELFRRLVLRRMAEVFTKGVWPLSLALNPQREDAWQAESYAKRFNLDPATGFTWDQDPTTKPK
jgi:hypothetical protein